MDSTGTLIDRLEFDPARMSPRGGGKSFPLSSMASVSSQMITKAVPQLLCISCC
jgi:hypothetical protein